MIINSQEELRLNSLKNTQKVEALECPGCNSLYREEKQLEKCIEMHEKEKAELVHIQKYIKLRDRLHNYIPENLKGINASYITSKICEAGRLIGINICIDSIISGKAKSVQAIECPTCNILHRNVEALSACLKMHNEDKISREIREKYENFRDSIVNYFSDNLMSLSPSPSEIGERISEAGKLIGLDIIINEVSFGGIPFKIHDLKPSTEESKKIMDLFSSCH